MIKGFGCLQIVPWQSSKLA